MRSTSTSPSHAFRSQPSGGRSGRKPMSTRACCARSTSSGFTKKSTSCSVFAPPRAHTASPPPSANRTSESRSAPAAFFIVCRMTSKSKSVAIAHGAVPVVCDSKSTGKELTRMPRVLIAAAGDLHADERVRPRIEEAFDHVADAADVVLLAGDLTAHGEPHELEIVASACASLDVPVYSVLGNHDYHAGRVDELAAMLEDAGVVVLERSWSIAAVNGTTLGVAGTKGFVGGFPGSTLPDFGEPLLRQVFAETGKEVAALDRALAEIGG